MLKKGRKMTYEKGLISVIIPAYNTSKYIKATIESLMKQTYTNLEIICIDDGSTDNTLGVLMDLERKDKRIKVIHKTNTGVSDTRNFGLSIAKGEYIGFIDSDDFVDKHYFEYLLNAINKYNVDIAICDFLEVFDESYENCIDNLEDVKIKMVLTKKIKEKYKVNVWGKLIRARIIKSVRFNTDLSFAEDTLFSLEALSLCKNHKVAIIPKPLYCYVMRNDSAMHSNNTATVKTHRIKGCIELYNRTRDYEAVLHILRDIAYILFWGELMGISSVSIEEYRKLKHKFLKELLFIKTPIKQKLVAIFISNKTIYKMITYIVIKGSFKQKKEYKHKQKEQIS